MNKLNTSAVLVVLLLACGLLTAVSSHYVMPVVDTTINRSLDIIEAENARPYNQAANMYELAEGKRQTAVLWGLLTGLVCIVGALFLMKGPELAKQGRLLLKEAKGKRKGNARPAPRDNVRILDMPNSNPNPDPRPVITPPQRSLLTDRANGGQEGDRWI